MTTHTVAFELSPVGFGKVEVDGVDLSSALSGISVVAEANTPTVIRLQLVKGSTVPASIVDADVQFYVSEDPTEAFVTFLRNIDGASVMNAAMDDLGYGDGATSPGVLFINKLIEMATGGRTQT